MNKWYGVRCNLGGHVISLPFFENALQIVQGIKPSFAKLIHLKHLSIFNGELEFEWFDNPNMNSIGLFPSEDVLSGLTDLEELNLHNVNMAGSLNYGLFKLRKLRFLNLAYNKLNGGISEFDWEKLDKLEMIELQKCGFSLSIP